MKKSDLSKAITMSLLCASVVVGVHQSAFAAITAVVRFTNKRNA